MNETTEQRQARLALFARDAVNARSDYRKEADAVVARTARLRAERLDRGAAISLPAPKAKVASASRKARPQAAVKAG